MAGLIGLIGVVVALALFVAPLVSLVGFFRSRATAKKVDDLGHRIEAIERYLANEAARQRPSTVVAPAPTNPEPAGEASSTDGPGAVPVPQVATPRVPEVTTVSPPPCRT